MLLQPDIVKLDRGLVDGIAGDPAKQALIDAFVRFAREIGSSVCAEGIEGTEDLVVLADLDVAIGQGYVVGRPSEQFTQPQEAAVRALQDATAAAQRFGASQTSRPAFVADRHLELAAERLGEVSSYESIGPALATIAEALHADGICVSRVISGGAVLKTVATYAIEGESSFYSLADYPATRTVIETGEAMQVIAGDPKADRIEVEALKFKRRSSLLMVPILSDGVGIGLLEAFASESRPWSRLGLARARLFAYQLGLLLEKLASKEHSPEEHLAETRAALTALGSIRPAPGAGRAPERATGARAAAHRRAPRRRVCDASPMRGRITFAGHATRSDRARRDAAADRPAAARQARTPAPPCDPGRARADALARRRPDLAPSSRPFRRDLAAAASRASSRRSCRAAAARSPPRGPR